MKRVLEIARRAARARRDVLVIAAIAALGCGFTVWLFQPGYMSHDSSEQLVQARSLGLSDHHPITMALLWRLLDALVPGPFGMLLLNSVLYWAGVGAFMGTRRWPLWLRAVMLPVVGAFPPVFCIAGAIWKDTVMQATLVAALGCFLVYERWRRLPLLLAGLVFTLFGLSVRHNAIGAAWPILALPIMSLPFIARKKLVYRVLLAGTASLTASLLSLVLLQKALSPLAAPAHFWQMIATFDLAGISVQTGQLQVERGAGVLSSGVGLREIRRGYQPTNHMSLYKCSSRRHRPCRPAFVRTGNDVELARLGANWWRAVREHPGAYFRHRYDVYALVSGLSGKPAKLWFLRPTGVARDYPLPSRAEAALDWFRSLSDSAWFVVWHYVALALAVLLAAIPFLLRTGSILPLVLALSSLGYAASLFFGAGAQDYRYSVWSVFAAVLAFIALLEPWKPRTKRATSAADTN